LAHDLFDPPPPPSEGDEALLDQEGVPLLVGFEVVLLAFGLDCELQGRSGGHQVYPMGELFSDLPQTRKNQERDGAANLRSVTRPAT
ncbi:MAG: hypothetical protein LYZ70_06925, partial [Nitrososphaerales archaeon]|nr:hypothetical protein [Nitrososphaerales archaeon]